LQIQRVQNITLYQQYQLKKRFLEEQKPNLPNGWPLERDLWHGTKGSNTERIAMHGFDRSYAGNYGKVQADTHFWHMRQGFPHQLPVLDNSLLHPFVRQVKCDDVTITLLVYENAFILLSSGRKQKLKYTNR